MARYILIDNNSGFIYGDSADIDGRIFAGTPAETAEALDRSIGGEPRTYEELSFRAHRDGASGYRVYRADVDGSEAVPVVTDGQDQETIDAVERDCRPVCFIAWK